MEWSVPVNEMLRDDITKITHTLLPPGFHGDIRSVRVVQESLSRLIDTLGEQSTAAQGLTRVITTAEKLRNSPTHSLYLLKDTPTKGGRGEVIGLLKVGRKHLFMFDERDVVREVEPLCVLDFFVRPDRQRHGYGRRLFDHMLKEEGVRAEQLAIDGPSPKMEQFLRKSYGVERLVRQNNNFAVAPQFFSANTELGDVPPHPNSLNGNGVRYSKASQSGRSTPVASPAVGRFAAPKPPSAIATVIHGGGSGGYYHDSSSRGSSRAGTPEAKAEPVPTPDAEPEAEPEPEAKEPSPERPTSLQVEAIETPLPPSEAPPALSPAGSTMSRRDSQLTDRGYFDVKFYHNKLW